MKFSSYKNWLNEEQVNGSVWRTTDQRWLMYLLDQDQTLDVEKYTKNPDKFISLSFDSDSGGMDSFGGKEIVIEFDEKLIFQQGAEEVFYEVDWFEDHPKESIYVTGYEGEKDYYDQHDFKNAEEAWAESELDWQTVVEDYEHEREILMKKIKYVPGLIKNVTFYEKPNPVLIEMLKENNIKYEIH